MRLGKTTPAVASASGSEEARLRRVALRLAAQTVGLLLVMLVVLEVVLYLVTRHTLLDSLQNTLKTRATQPDPSVCISLHLPCAGPIPQPQDGIGQTGFRS